MANQSFGYKSGELLPYRLEPIDRLIPYARNSRTHSDEQIAKLMASIREFGFTNPVLIDGECGIIAGHGRVLAAQRLGMAEVPVIELAHLSAVQRRAYVLADNRLALDAGWDPEMLRIELGDLQFERFDLALTGFEPGEIADSLADRTAGLTDPDDAPEAPDDPVSVLGDVWLLGRHRLVCGDCTDALVVEKTLAGVKPHLMVTDPPYGVSYDADWRNKRMRSDGTPIAGRAVGKVENDNRPDWREAWGLFPGDVAYVWHAGLHARSVVESLEAAGFAMRAQIIWAKSRFAIGRGDYHFQHEPCWYAVRSGRKGHWAAGRDQTTLWQISHTKSETGHSTQKPVECMRRPLENNSSPGQTVYEPFSGSGTTIIAAEMTGRACHAVEIAPQYCDVAVLRWQAFTGQKATLDGDGRAFDEIAGERRGTRDDARAP